MIVIKVVQEYLAIPISYIFILCKIEEIIE